MQRPLSVSQSLHSPHCLYIVLLQVDLTSFSASEVARSLSLRRLCWKLGLSITCFRFGKIPPPTSFSLCSKILSFFLMLSLLVILRSCIASLKVLNYDLEDRLKKVYDCVRFIQTIPMVWASIAHSRCLRSIILQTHQNAFLSSQIYFSTNSSISCLKCGCRIVNFIL